MARSRNISFYEDCLFTAECNCKLTAAVVTSPRTTQTQSWHGSGEHFIEPVYFFSIESAKFWPLLAIFFTNLGTSLA